MAQKIATLTWVLITGVFLFMLSDLHECKADCDFEDDDDLHCNPKCTSFDYADEDADYAEDMCSHDEFIENTEPILELKRYDDNIFIQMSSKNVRCHLQ